jgi:hypothetical protein
MRMYTYVHVNTWITVLALTNNIASMTHVGNFTDMINIVHAEYTPCKRFMFAELHRVLIYPLRRKGVYMYRPI